MCCGVLCFALLCFSSLNDALSVIGVILLFVPGFEADFHYKLPRFGYWDSMTGKDKSVDIQVADKRTYEVNWYISGATYRHI